MNPTLILAQLQQRLADQVRAVTSPTWRKVPTDQPRVTVRGHKAELRRIRYDD